MHSRISRAITQIWWQSARTQPVSPDIRPTSADFLLLLFILLLLPFSAWSAGLVLVFWLRPDRAVKQISNLLVADRQVRRIPFCEASEP